MRAVYKFLVLLLLCAASSLPALFIRSMDGFLPPALLAALLLCSFSAALGGYIRLGGSLHWKNTQTVRGAVISGTCRIENRSLFAFGHVLATLAIIRPNGETEHITRDFALPPRQSRAIPLFLLCPHIGQYQIRLEKLAIRDLTGLFTLSKRMHLSVDLIASPRMDGASGTLPGSRTYDGQNPYTRSQHTAAGLYDGARRYESGDPIRSIHWKLSAHTGTLMTRTFENPFQRTLDIVADLYPNDHTPEEFDCLTEEPLHAAAAACNRGMHVSIWFQDPSGPHVMHIATWNDLSQLGIRWAMLSGRLADKPGAVPVLPDRSETGITVYTARLTAALEQALVARQQSGVPCTLLWVTGKPPAETDARLSKLRHAGVDCPTYIPNPRPSDTAEWNQPSGMGGNA